MTAISLSSVKPLALAVLLTGCAVHASERPEPLRYGCDELVAIGRVETLSYTDMTGADDLLGHGLFVMQVTVKRLLRGTDTRRVLPTRRVAHGQLREDRDFLLVLTPTEDDGYVLRTATLWGARPRPVLSQQCEPMAQIAR